MSDDNKIDYVEAIFQLHEATNKLRKITGEEPKPFVKPKPPFCSFCGKCKNEVVALLSSPSPEILICNECIRKAQEIIDGMEPNES